MPNPAGKSSGEIFRLDFNRRLMVQFRGSVVTSDAGLLDQRELDLCGTHNGTDSGCTLLDVRRGVTRCDPQSLRLQTLACGRRDLIPVSRPRELLPRDEGKTRHES
jgi:hypothetical protein